jgi:hypothetical protein
MTEIFQGYEEEFRSTAQEAQKKISDVLMYETNPGRLFCVRAIGRESDVMEPPHPPARKRDGIKQAETRVRSLEELVSAL